MKTVENVLPSGWSVLNVVLLVFSLIRLKFHSIFFDIFMTLIRLLDSDPIGRISGISKVERPQEFQFQFSVAQVDEVKPLRLKRGEPQLTMASIFNLEDLAPFFAAICNGVTRQQTKGWTTSTRVGGGATIQVWDNALLFLLVGLLQRGLIGRHRSP